MKYDSVSKKSTYHIDCIHKQHLINQGMTFCFKGDITKCDECLFKEPRDVETECSLASISTED